MSNSSAPKALDVTALPIEAREAIAETKHRKSRLWENAAILTIVATMMGAVATMVSNMTHDYAAVRIAEAKARECRP